MKAILTETTQHRQCGGSVNWLRKLSSCEIKSLNCSDFVDQFEFIRRLL